ncbi:MAG: PIN domain-containing protein [bacterium]
MAAVIYLDTHVVVWLYSGRFDLIPQSAKDLLNSHELRISPMVRLELQYLYEIERLTKSATVVFNELAGAIGLVVCTEPFAAIVTEAERQPWTHDPFDRIIVAQSAFSSSVLVTKDEHPRQLCSCVLGLSYNTALAIAEASFRSTTIFIPFKTLRRNTFNDFIEFEIATLNACLS